MKVHTSKLVMLGVAVLTSVGIVSCGGGVASALDITADYTVPTEGATEKLVIKSGSSVTVTLNGDLVVKGSDAIYVEEGATLTIEGNGKVTATDRNKAPLHINGGTVVINGGHIYKDEGCTDATVNPETGRCQSGATQFYAIFNERGSLTINGGIVEIANYERTIAGASLINNRTLSGDNKQATLIINGGTIIGGVVNVKNELGSNAVINGGIFKGATTSSLHNMNTMTVNGGEFSTLNPDEYGLILTGEGDSAGAPVSSSGEVTINGGVFNATYLFEDWTNDPYTPVKIAPIISDGEFNVEHMCMDSVAEDSALRTPEITGGTFANGVELPTLPNGYVSYDVVDPTTKEIVSIVTDQQIDFTAETIEHVMKVGETYNLNLPEFVIQNGAINNFVGGLEGEDGGTVTVNGNTITATAAGHATVTVWFNGQTKTYNFTIADAETPEVTPPVSTDDTNTDIAAPNTGVRVASAFTAIFGVIVAILAAVYATKLSFNRK